MTTMGTNVTTGDWNHTLTTDVWNHPLTTTYSTLLPPVRRYRIRYLCDTCDRIAGWPDRPELEGFQIRTGGKAHLAEPGVGRSLCGRVR